MTRIVLNGEERHLSGACDLASAIAFFLPVDLPVGIASESAAPTGVAAAVNDRVVPRSTWGRVTLREGDRVEIVTAVQGG